MTDIASLAVEIKTGDVRKARKELDDLTSAGARAERSTASMSAGFGGLRSVLGGIGFAAVASEVIKTADAYTNLSSRLGLVTQNTSQLARVQADLFAVAQESRSVYLETGELYAKLARSTQALGKTQTETVGVTRSINQALVISGASAQASAAALTQLGQGFASGVLRGEELNSVLEQAPRLAQAIADGLGVSVGKLRALGEAGELTAEKVFGALQGQAVKLQSEFERMPTTVGGALTQVGNSVGSLIGELDKASGATSKLATLLSGVAATTDIARELVFGNSEAAKLNAEIRFLETNIKAAEQQTGLMAIVFEGTVRSQKERLAAAREELGVMQRQRAEVEQREAAIARNERARRIVPGGTEEQQSARAALLKKYATDAEKLRTALSDARKELGSLFTPEIEKRITEGLTPKGARANPYAEEVKSLREKALTLKETSELERTNAEITLGKFGKLRPAQEEELRGLARSVDLRREAIDAVQREKEARDAATAALTRTGLQQLKDLDALQAGNQALRDEIELLGAGTLATAAIEKARIGATIALKEQRIATLEASGVAEQQLQVLYAEIEALRERQGLIDTKAGATLRVQAEQDARETGRKVNDTLADSIEAGILDGFRRGQSLTDIFLNELKAQFAKTILRPVIAPVAEAGNQLIGALIQAGVSAYLGGKYSGTSTDVSAPNYENSLDRMNVKGSLAVGTNRVPEDGLYMLHKDEAVQPAAYNPAMGGRSAPSVTVNLIGAPEGTQVQQPRQDAGGNISIDVIYEQFERRLNERTAAGYGVATGVQKRFGGSGSVNLPR